MRAGGRILSDRSNSLTDDEGTLLALVVRAGPLTTYQIAKIYENSPVSNFNTSKGKLYPLVKRLKTFGLIEGLRVDGDARGTELMHATDKGRAAVKQWVMQLKPAHILLDDPLRTKLQSFDLLTAKERRDWVRDVRRQLAEKLDQLEQYAEEVEVPFHQGVHDNAVSSVEARLAWLDRLEQSLSDGGTDRARAARAN